jgi:hypothetical protein
MRTASGRGGIVVAIVAALALATLISLALWRLGPLAMLVALFPLLTLATFIALSVVPMRLHLPRTPWRRRGRRPGRGRGWGQRGDGWDPAGVREPRRPRPPYYPPRGEAVEPPMPSV